MVWAEISRVQTVADARDLSLLQNVQICPGVHPASYLMVTEVSFLTGKATRV
jgi:hypothetical protein